MLTIVSRPSFTDRTGRTMILTGRISLRVLNIDVLLTCKKEMKKPMKSGTAEKQIGYQERERPFSGNANFRGSSPQGFVDFFDYYAWLPSENGAVLERKCYFHASLFI